MGKTQNLYKKAKKIISGGTQLFSKRPELYLPGLWPAYYKKARGCEIWDLDGRRYIDMSYMGIGSCLLGYADGDVDRAVKESINKGSMATLNCPEEFELARLLCEIHPWADMVRFARTGGEAMAVAVRIARTKTEKDVVLFCGYHGWHDWYLAANLTDNKSLDGHLLPGLKPKGVPRGLRATAFPFNYNDIDRFLELVKTYRNKIAAVIMEPVRNHYPDKGFLETIRYVTRKYGIILIFDEITSGWRLNPGGAHLKLKVYPDIAVFAKAISNGYAMAAIIGKRQVMNEAQNTFISSTYWTERIGVAAAIATIRKIRQKNVPRYLMKVGKRVQEAWVKSANNHGLRLFISGIPPLGHFSFEYKEPLVLKTLFTQLMLEKGFLATNVFYASFAHKDDYIKRYIAELDKAFAFISRVIKKGKPERYLKGPVCHSSFKRLT